MTAEELIKQFNLKKLEPEGGYFVQTYKSEITQINPDSSIRNARSILTSIYYLLEKNDFSAFHKLTCTEIYHFYSGATVELFTIDLSGKLLRTKLGQNYSDGEIPQVIVPANTWQASRILDASTQKWTLLGTTCSPGFEFSDFEMGDEKLISQFPNYREIIAKLIRQ